MSTQPADGVGDAPVRSTPRFYSVPEAARLIGTAPVTLYRAIRDGEFPAVRVRGRLIVPAQAIEAMVDAAIADQETVDAAAWVNPIPRPRRGV